MVCGNRQRAFWLNPLGAEILSALVPTVLDSSCELPDLNEQAHGSKEDTPRQSFRSHRDRPVHKIGLNGLNGCGSVLDPFFNGPIAKDDF